MKTEYGHNLEFISRILRDGSGTVDDKDYEYLDNISFNLQCLSITHGTWIASEFNSYVVKIKRKQNAKTNPPLPYARCQ